MNAFKLKLRYMLLIPSLTAVNVLFVWLAEVSADQTVDNFIISRLSRQWAVRVRGLSSADGAGPSVLSLGQSPSLRSPGPGLAQSGRPPVTAQLILDCGLTGETVRTGSRESWKLSEISFYWKWRIQNMRKCRKHSCGDICEGHKYNFVGKRWDAKTLNMLFTSRPELQEW